MREIKFRGKRVDTGEWVYGYVVQTKDDTYICYSGQYNDDLFLSPENILIKVIPETVSQHTGLKDKSGKEIYESDILKYKLTGFGEKILKVFLKDGIFQTSRSSISAIYHICEVIGNIHENPELLEG